MMLESIAVKSRPRCVGLRELHSFQVFHGICVKREIYNAQDHFTLLSGIF